LVEKFLLHFALEKKMSTTATVAVVNVTSGAASEEKFELSTAASSRRALGPGMHNARKEAQRMGFRFSPSPSPLAFLSRASGAARARLSACALLFRLLF